MRRRRRLSCAWCAGLVLGGLLSLACHRAFVCEQDSQCALAGAQGRCEATGSCSFPDDGCPSGYRYGEHAARGLVDACVEVDASASSSGQPEVETDVSTSGTTGETATGSGRGSSEDGESSGGAGSTSGTTGDCPSLAESGPVVVEADGQVIEGLRITTNGLPGITLAGYDDVVIRDCEIHHDGAPGISFAAADRLTIQNVIIVHDRVEPGPHEHRNQASITGSNSEQVVIDQVRVTRGATGIELADTPGAQLTMIEGHDIRGPGPPASFIQVSNSDGVVLDGFSCINPLDTGRPGSLVLLQESSDVTVRNGLLDGHNAEFGYGVLFEQTSGQHSGGLVEDVDTLRMTNGSFSGFPSAFDIVFRRTRVRDNICEILSVPIPECSNVGRNGGCIPGSNGRSWTGAPRLSGLVIEDSSYFALCHGAVWPESAFATCDGDGSGLPPGDCGLTEQDFTPRSAIEVEPCWE